MTMNEKRVESIRKEIEKYEAQLAKREEKLAKKLAAAEKLNAVEYDKKWDEEGERINEFMIERTKENAKKVGAYFALSMAKDEVEETKRNLENAHKRLEKLMPKAEADGEKREQDARADEMESKFYSAANSTKSKEEREAEYLAWLEWFKAECLKDGVIVEHADGWSVGGLTASGKTFWIYGNSGTTLRSWHCYTLRVDGETIFTSGEFSTCYNRIKR